MWINPTPIVIKAPNFLGKNALDLAEKRVRLYHIVALRSDMSLVSTLCVSSLSSSTQIGLPTEKVGRRSRHKREGKELLRHLSPPFVVPDDLPDKLAAREEELVRVPTTTQHLISNKGPQNVTQRFTQLFYEHLSSTSANQEDKAHVAGSSRGVVRSNPFSAAHLNIEQALEKGVVPIRTLYV
jgi:hypothetical protein